MSAKIGLYGLGSIGTAMAIALTEQGFDVVAAIDKDPQKVGKDLGSLCQKGNIGVEISEFDPEIAGECDVILHSTCSRLREAFPQISEIVEARCNLISTCEELSYPYLRNQELSMTLDQLAKDSGATVLGTGVNPGFLLDALPVFVTKPCRKVQSISASRIVEASLRREPLQRKIGLGKDPEEFRERSNAGNLGHVGLFESCALIATAMGWRLTKIKQDISPLVAEGEMETSYFEIAPGQVRGLRQEVIGIGDGERIRLYLEMSVGAKEPGDSVKIQGDPPIEFFISGGLNGDIATVGRAIGHIDDVLIAEPGLTTVLGLPLAPHGARPALVGGAMLTGTGRLL